MDTIDAYDEDSRAAAYDADMDVMHPNRRRMAEVVLEVLPFPRDAEIAALDLGTGTGYLAGRFLGAYPSARLVGVDGADAMLASARHRLGPASERAELRRGDIKDLGALFSGPPKFDAVFSMYTLHHFDPAGKRACVAAALKTLKPGGWFVNADILRDSFGRIEERFQQLRAAGIVERARPGDERFRDAAATRRYLAEMEAKEGDCPLALSEDLDVLSDAGLGEATVFWLEYREAVTGGVR